VEDTSQQVDSGIAAWMECVTVNIMWKILHSRWTEVLQLEWSTLQWTFFEIVDYEDWRDTTNGYSYFLVCTGRFSLEKFWNAKFRLHHKCCSKPDKIQYPSFQKSTFVPPCTKQA